MSRRTVLGGLVGGLGVLAACSSGSRARSASPSTASPSTTPTTEPELVPPAGDDWPTIDAETAGWDPQALDAAAAFAEERASRSLLVVLDGQILLERHWAGAEFTRDIASAQKSIVSALTGIAHDERNLDLDAPVAEYLDVGWSAAPAADEPRITVHHLLTMTTGLDESLRVQAEPGTVWDYNSTTYQLLRPVVERATGIGIVELTRQRLWDPIGVSDAAVWAPRPGSARTSVDPLGNRLWGLTMGARDMARFGLLVQRGGAWAGEQIVPEAELARALEPQELNPAYGELWWVNGQDSYRLPQRPLQEGMLVPSAPEDMVAALGKDDQKIYVSRSLGLVVTRIGGRAGDQAMSLSSFDDELWSRLMAAAP